MINFFIFYFVVLKHRSPLCDPLVLSDPCTILFFLAVLCFVSRREVVIVTLSQLSMAVFCAIHLELKHVLQ